MVYAFISYSSKDVKFAEKLEADLIANSIRIWRDKSRLRGDNNWDDEIENALSSSELTHVLIIWSANSSKSEMVKNEIEYARNEGKKLVVLTLDGTKRALLIARRHCLSFQQSYDKGFHSLLKTLAEIKKPLSKIISPSIPVYKLTDEQLKAAHDPAKLVRLIAAPGTGKSFVIEERVKWLIENGVEPKTICVLSYTRAASRDLQDRIVQHCLNNNISNSEEVRVSTLHSLALRALRKAKLLHYPVSPTVLDNWEIQEIFDSEFSTTKRHSIPQLSDLKPSRARVVREAYEAFWDTGQWSPPNYLRPENPVTQFEKGAFRDFHPLSTQVYSCILPGEIVQKCVENINSGLLDLNDVLGVKHLIIDEFQDLNFTDLQFVDSFITDGTSVFVAGDDDQSIYSFRYAYPTGIQEFTQKYQNVSEHWLKECFRCTPRILRTGVNLIDHNKSPQRIPKSVFSFCNGFTPELEGIIHTWKVKSEKAEFTAIAESCKALIERGILHQDILILISTRRLLEFRKNKPTLFHEVFEKLGVAVDTPNGTRYIDTDCGRLVYSLLRIICDEDIEDFLAHRTVLGLLKGVGKVTISGIRDKVITNHLSYLKLFYNDIPSGVFNPSETKSIKRLSEICDKLIDLQSEDSISLRSDNIKDFVLENCGQEGVVEFETQIDFLPEEMNLSELRQFLSTDNSEQQERILETVYTRLELEIPEDGLLPKKVRVMTMHGSKGLNADVVFIPGLETDFLPGEKRSKYPGLVQESARQLYVSITRARLACFVSFATSRLKFGKREYDRSPSKFCGNLLSRFHPQDGGITDSEADAIIEAKEIYQLYMKNRLSQ